MTYQPPAMVYIEHFNIHHIEPYLIFVIFFTLTNVESWKFYTRKVRKFTTNGAQGSNFLVFFSNFLHSAKNFTLTAFPAFLTNIRYEFLTYASTQASTSAYRALINVHALAKLLARVHDALQPCLALPVPLMQDMATIKK